MLKKLTNKATVREYKVFNNKLDLEIFFDTFEEAEECLRKCLELDESWYMYERIA